MAIFVGEPRDDKEAESERADPTASSLDHTCSRNQNLLKGRAGIKRLDSSIVSSHNKRTRADIKSSQDANKSCNRIHTAAPTSKHQRQHQTATSMMINTKQSTTDICMASKMPKTRLADNFEPNSYTVLCGRGKEFFNYSGNRRFRVLVDMNLERYSLAETKSDKTRIVCEIVHMIRESGGGFCKQDNNGTWYEVGDSIAREKVGALFRDCLFNMYKSSSKAKTAARRQRRARSKKNQPLRCRGGASSSSGSITDSMTDSSYDSASSKGGAYHEQCRSPEDSTADIEPMNVKEVRFTLNEQDLQPLLYDIEYDLDDVAAFDFAVEV